MWTDNPPPAAREVAPDKSAVTPVTPVTAVTAVTAVTILQNVVSAGAGGRGGLCGLANESKIQIEEKTDQKILI